MIGRIIQKRYTIQELIGQGGMGKIYSALDLNSGSRVAIKIMDTLDPAAVERFLTEARAMADIRHKNVIRIFAAEEYDQRPYMVMELLEGKDLKGYIGGKPLGWEEARRILLGVCDGIQAAHSKGIMHRDLKPENIFISKDGNPKVLDFGLAKFMDREDGPHTATGMFAGTPKFTAPEQINDRKNMDHRVDIYALGIIMYNMMTGEVPFSSEIQDQAGANAEILMKQINEPPLPPSIKFPDFSIPRAVEDIILKAMQKRKEDRYNNIGELRDAIIHCEGISSNMSLGNELLESNLQITPEPVAVPVSGHGTLRKLLLVAALAGTGLIAYAQRGQLMQDLELAKASSAKIAAKVRSDLDRSQDTTPPKQEPTQPDTAIKTFQVQIDSDPPGSRVYDVTNQENAVDLGTTPLTRKLADGEHRLLVKSKAKQEKRLVVSPAHPTEKVVFEKPKNVRAKTTETDDIEGAKPTEDNDPQTEGAPADDNDTPAGTEDTPSN